MMNVNPTISEFISNLNNIDIPEERQLILNQLVEIILENKLKRIDANLVFVCTHNSRRSHIAQIWAQTLSAFYAIKNIQCYSSGTEVTALYPMVLEVLKDVGFSINILNKCDNPIYSIKYHHNAPPIIGFSKTITNAFNPKSNFCAIMTCSSADKKCPIVKGAEHRLVLAYDDPKVSDNTPLERQTYYERSLQIATELNFVFSQLNL